MCDYLLGDQVCHVLLWALCTSKLLIWQGLRTSGLKLLTCLYSNSLMYRKRSASSFGVLLFDKCLEIHLQNRSVLCICSRVCSLSLVSGFGVASGVSVTVVISGVTVSYRVWSEIFCYVSLCSSAPGIECGFIMIGGSEHLNCGLPNMW